MFSGYSTKSACDTHAVAATGQQWSPAHRSALMMWKVEGSRGQCRDTMSLCRGRGQGSSNGCEFKLAAC